MTQEHTGTAAFRRARFVQCDLAGATFRDSDLRHVRIASSMVDDLRITGFDGEAGTVSVDDVVVTGFVAAELDRRHPERVQLRAVTSADDHRAMWTALEGLWARTRARAEVLPEELRHRRVEDEWSVVETLRHLVFAIDSWVGHVLRPEPSPYHRLALAPTDWPAEASAAVGLDPAARPTWDEVVRAHAERCAQVRAVLADVTDDDLPQRRSGVLDPGAEPETFTVDHCLRVLLREHCEHRRYAERDLAALEAEAAPTT